MPQGRSPAGNNRPPPPVPVPFPTWIQARRSGSGPHGPAAPGHRQRGLGATRQAAKPDPGGGGQHRKPPTPPPPAGGCSAQQPTRRAERTYSGVGTLPPPSRPPSCPNRPPVPCEPPAAGLPKAPPSPGRL